MAVFESEVHFREDALLELARIIERRTISRLMLIVDQAAYDATNASSIVESALQSYHVVRFADFEPNPKLVDIKRGAQLFRESDSEMVIAIGGGTAIDIGKVIAVVGHETSPIREIITGAASLTQVGVPLVAIPTTAGTGSEATCFAVAYVDGEKYSLDNPALLPDVAIIDPRLTHSLPPGITAATGLDAFCQAIESIWSVGATDESIGYATEAVKLAFANLSSAVNQPSPESRLAMCRASHLAGKAINISRTTAPHALSYPLTSRRNIPHGIAVALTISPMLSYNANVSKLDCVDRRGAEHVRDRIGMIVELLGANSVADARHKIEDLIASVGCPRSLGEAGVTDRAELESLISRVNVQRMSNNPRRTSQESLIELLAS